MVLVMLRHFAWLPWQDHARELKKKIEEFSNLNSQIVLVSFGETNGASRWYNENQINKTLDMITDHQRIIYKSFGFKKSFFCVWCTECLIYYAEQLNFKRQLPKAYQDVEDDPHQMGGNLILKIETTDQEELLFKIAYVYRSKNPPDRPSANDMIKFIQNLNE